MLLRYADDFSPIYFYPALTISSYFIVPKNLCECMLWTIESIRVKYPFKDNRNQFVAKGIPMLLDKKFSEEYLKDSRTNPLEYRLDEKRLKDAYEAYINWWANYYHENFKEIKKINPLENLNCVWY